MQRSFSRFSKNDYTRYPFLKQARKYQQAHDLQIEDLGRQELAGIITRAYERVEEAICFNCVSRNLHSDEDTEILSFPVAIILTLATGDSLVQKKYALAEARLMEQDFQKETSDRLVAIGTDLGWEITFCADRKDQSSAFKLNFVDYLRNTKHLQQEKKWKLVNRALSGGYVRLSTAEVARLLSEEVRHYIEKRQNIHDMPKMPASLTVLADRLLHLAQSQRSSTEIEEFPASLSEDSFPPCVTALYRAFSSGHHLSHVGRFTLTSFLVNVGMPSEKLIELFKSFSDFDEKMTRYQVEHIAGTRGSGTRYRPPKCETLKTHGICTNPDKLCGSVKHPLGYYKRKIHQTQKWLDKLD